MKTKTAPVHLDASHLSDEFDKSKKTTEWTTYRCHLVTPMYGGGVRAGVVDRQQPFRATAIRGQLRQWWRWANESRFKTPEGKPDHQALFDAERKLWGGLGDDKTLRASRVVVRVENLRTIYSDRWTEWTSKTKSDDKDEFQKQILLSDKQNGELLNNKYQFQEPDFILKWSLSDSQLKTQVEQAFRLWASFGGVGARRRRGLGAIEVYELEIQNEKQTYKQIISNENDIENINAELISIDLPKSEKIQKFDEAVEWGLKTFNHFRQKPGLARGQLVQKKPGESRWPEANVIRALTNTFRSKSEEGMKKYKEKSFFPRAFLGLPIQFQFKASYDQGDPEPSTLYPYVNNKRLDRMSSPLIFTAIKNKNGYSPAILILNTKKQTYEMGLFIKNKTLDGEGKIILPNEWWPKDKINIKENLPKDFRRLSDSGDVYDIFKEFFKKYNPNTGKI